MRVEHHPASFALDGGFLLGKKVFINKKNKKGCKYGYCYQIEHTIRYYPVE